MKHIIDEYNFIENSLRNKTFDKFVNDDILKRAIVRSLEVIGEAVKNISNEFRENHPQIPWRKLAGLRDVLIHQYFGVDYANIWKIVKEDLKTIKNEIERIFIKT